MAVYPATPFARSRPRQCEPRATHLIGRAPDCARPVHQQALRPAIHRKPDEAQPKQQKIPPWNWWSVPASVELLNWLFARGTLPEKVRQTPVNYHFRTPRPGYSVGYDVDGGLHQHAPDLVVYAAPRMFVVPPKETVGVPNDTNANGTRPRSRTKSHPSQAACQQTGEDAFSRRP